MHTERAFPILQTSLPNPSKNTLLAAVRPSGREPATEDDGSLRRHPLDPFFRPRSVVVIGATEQVGSVGRAIIENLASWKGETFFVNPAHTRVFECKSYPSVHSLPRVPDLAIIVTPARVVPGIVSECASL